MTNVLTLILNSHETKTKDVVNAMTKNFTNLNKKIKIEVDERLIIVCVFTIIFIENTFQQTNNNNFLKY